MRTQFSQLPFDDVLFPLDVFLKHIKCLFLGLGLGGNWEGRGKLAVNCPIVGVAWGESCSHLPGLPLLVYCLTWSEKFPNGPADPISSALPDPWYFLRGS